MLVSTTAKYAIRALMEIAKLHGEQPLLIREISQRSGIPFHYLSKIVQTLVKEQILKSTKGRGGGLQFFRKPKDVYLSDVVRAIEGEVWFNTCLFTLQECDGTGNCPVHARWGSIRDQILRFLNTTSIADIAHKSDTTKSSLSTKK